MADPWCAWCDLYKNDAETPETCDARDAIPWEHVWVLPLHVIAAALDGLVEGPATESMNWKVLIGYETALTETRRALLGEEG